MEMASVVVVCMAVYLLRVCVSEIPQVVLQLLKIDSLLDRLHLLS